MRNPLTVAFAKNIVEATITEADLVTPAMRRIRLEPDVPIPHVPGQHIRIEVNDPLSPRGLLRPLKTLRTYSVWAYDTKAIDMLAHLYDHDGGGGIGLRWAPGARPGDRSPQHDLPMPHRPGLRRVHRHGASAHRSETLLAALAALDLPAEPGAAYIAGEARTCQMARDHLVREPGWPRTTISVKPFWTPGKRGLH